EVMSKVEFLAIVVGLRPGFACPQGMYERRRGVATGGGAGHRENGFNTKRRRKRTDSTRRSEGRERIQREDAKDRHGKNAKGSVASPHHRGGPQRIAMLSGSLRHPSRSFRAGPSRLGVESVQCRPLRV